MWPFTKKQKQLTPQEMFAKTAEAMQAMAETTNAKELKRIIIKYESLLFSEYADYYLSEAQKIAQEKQQPVYSKFIKELQDILSRCRSEGVEEAFKKIEYVPLTELAKAPSDYVLKIKELHTKLGTLSFNENELPERIKVTNEILLLIDKNDNGLGRDLYPYMKEQAGLNYSEHTHTTENIETAIAHHREALSIFREKKSYADIARVQHNLADAFIKRISGNTDQNIDFAIENLLEALEFRRIDNTPEQWALSQKLLGNAYEKVQKGDKKQNINKALDCYNNALQVYTKEKNIGQWADIQKLIAQCQINLREPE